MKSEREAAWIALLDKTRTESGRRLIELIDEGPVLLIFLRHFGCAFCRQALRMLRTSALSLRRGACGQAFVHLGTPERAKPLFRLLSPVRCGAREQSRWIALPRAGIWIVAGQRIPTLSSCGVDCVGARRFTKIWNRHGEGRRCSRCRVYFYCGSGRLRVPPASHDCGPSELSGARENCLRLVLVCPTADPETDSDRVASRVLPRRLHRGA